MKKIQFLFGALVIAGVAFMTSCNTEPSVDPLAYHDTLYEATDSMIDYVFDFEDAVYYEEGVETIEAEHAELMSVIATSKAAVEAKGAYKDDAAFKDACMNMINFYEDYCGTQYPEIVTIMSADSLTYDDWDRIDEIINNFYDEESEYLNAFDEASSEFANTYEIYATESH